MLHNSETTTLSERVSRNKKDSVRDSAEKRRTHRQVIAEILGNKKAPSPRAFGFFTFEELIQAVSSITEIPASDFMALNVKRGTDAYTVQQIVIYLANRQTQIPRPIIAKRFEIASNKVGSIATGFQNVHKESSEFRALVLIILNACEKLAKAK